MDTKPDKESLIARINKHPLAGTDYFSCIQCGRCVGSCPAATVSEKFNMRIINKRIMDGDESLLSEETIWDCFYCHTCVNLCPRDNIDSYKTILILRDLALESGHGIDHMKNILPIMDSYLKKGVIVDESEPSWMSLQAIEEVRWINSITGMTERVLTLARAYEASKAKEEKKGS